MKKTYTYEITRKVMWPKKRCPKCGSAWIEIWHQINPDAFEANEPFPYNAAWHIECAYCDLATVTFHNKRYMWKAWKDICEHYKDCEEG